MQRDVFFAVDVGVDGREVVLPFELQAVAGVEDECSAAGLDFAAKFAVDRTNLAGFEVFALDDVKAEAAQLVGHGAGVVHRVGERAAFVGGVADDQGKALVVAAGGLRSQVAVRCFGGRRFGCGRGRGFTIVICPD